MAATVTGILLTGNHASRPAASAVSAGTLYSCTTHSLVYQSDGSSTWSTWATLGTSTTTVATDTIWDSAGDLAVGTGADTAAKLSITVPAANILNVPGVVNGETTWSVKSIHDGTAPVTQAFGDSAAAGTALTAAHRDHKHGMPSNPVFHGARAYHSTTQSCTGGAYTYLVFDSERYDTDSIHSTSSNTGRLTVPTTGYYRISGSVVVGSQTGGAVGWCVFRVNGSTLITIAPLVDDGGVVGAVANYTCDYQLSATDYVEMGVRPDGTGNALSGSNYSPEFMISLIGV